MQPGENGSPPLRVLRLCSVFEAPTDALLGRGVRFDPVGGMQNHTAQLTRALDALGVRQDVVTHRPPLSGKGQQLEARAVVHRHGLPIPWLRQLFAAPAAVKALRLAPCVDLVHAHQGEDLAVLPIALAASRVGHVPLVITLHTSLRHTFAGDDLRSLVLKTAGSRIEPRACRRADAVISLTNRLAGQLARDGVRSSRIHVIPPGVGPVEGSRGADSREPGSPERDPFPDIARPRIVFVGRLAYQKGVETLVDAVASMMRSDAHLVLVGDGPRRRAIQDAVSARALGERAHLVGFRSHREIPTILGHCDVFCLPSRFEELSSALLEAMHAGLPIVATRVGGVPEALGPAGVLVEPDDPGSLARALDRLLSNARLADRLGEMARERASGYEWSAIARQVLDVYRIVRHQMPGQSINVLSQSSGWSRAAG